MKSIERAENTEQEEAKQLGAILSTLIWAAWGVFLYVMFTAIYDRDSRLIVVTLAGCAALVLPMVLLKRRNLRASSLILVLIMLGIVTLLATIGQGIRDISIIAYPILFIFAGQALERKYFRLCVGLALLAVCWLVFGETFGWFTPVPFTGGMTNWFYLVGVTIILLVAALAVDLLAKNMRRNLERARAEIALRKHMEKDVLQLNASLEQRVEERTKQLHETQEQLLRHEKLAVLGQMAGSVGHELRNPLGVINSAVYYLRLIQPEADEDVRKYNGMIEQEVRNAEKIINDLLDFARGNSVECEQVAIPELVQHVLEHFPPSETIAVSIELPANLPKLFVDPRQVEQVLGNLVINACQAMKAGGRLIISAQASTSKDGQPAVCIRVKDTGSGISPENMPKIFEPLFTTKASGIGLGLAVSKKLTEANGGRIEVESEVGKGSTFTVSLPVESKKS